MAAIRIYQLDRQTAVIMPSSSLIRGCYQTGKLAFYAFKEIDRPDIRYLMVDLCRVSTVDDYLLGILTRLHLRAVNLRKVLVVCGATKFVAQAFSELGFEKLFNFSPSLEEAYREFCVSALELGSG